MFPNKRQRFLFFSLLLATLEFYLARNVQFYYSVPILFFSGILVTLWVLGDLKFPEHLFFPVFTCFSLLLGWFFLREFSFFLFLPKVFSLLLSLVLGSFFFYLLFLTLNILNVATIRTVPLKQAAFSTFFLLALFIFFLLAFLLQLNYPSVIFWVLVLSVGVFLLSLSLFGIVFAVEKISWRWSDLAIYGFIGVLSISEVAMVSYFWPISNFRRSLFLASVLFTVWGILQHHLLKSLNRRLIREYLFFGIIFLLFYFLSA